MPKRPNILLIMTDNQPAQLLGCYGNAEISTPHIDALAADGFRFANAFSVNGMCSPCRASVLTGLMPSQHGIHTWIDDRLHHLWPADWNALDELRTLPEILAEHGYATALIGKYHLGAPENRRTVFSTGSPARTAMSPISGTALISRTARPGTTPGTASIISPIRQSIISAPHPMMRRFSPSCPTTRPMAIGRR